MNLSDKGFRKLVRLFFWSSIGLTLLFSLGMLNLQFDYDFEKFFPKDSEETDYFLNYREEFDSDNDYMLLGIRNSSGVFDYDFLKDVDSVTSRLESLELVDFVVSITNQYNYAVAPLGLQVLEIPYINFEEKNAEKDSTSLFNNEELVGILIDQKAEVVNIYIKHQNYLSKAKCDTLLKEVRNILADFTFDEVHLSGRAVGQSYYVSQMQKELLLFFIVSAVLVILFLFIAFRSFQGIFFPLIIVLSSMIWIFGFMGVIQKPMNILLTILPTIMFVVSMSDVIHFVSRYIDEKRIGEPSIRALKTTVREVGLATFLTSFTTSVGFFSLVLVKVEPVADFGIYTGIGVILAFVATYGMLPFFLLLSNQIDGRGLRSKSSFWEKYLRIAFTGIMTNRKKIYWGMGVIVVLSIWGITKIDRNHYILDDLSEEAPVKQDALFFDQYFGGVRPFELAVILGPKADSITDLKVLQEMNKIEVFLKDEYGVGRINSLVTVFKTLNRIYHTANPEFFKLPESNKEVKKYQKKFLSRKSMDLTQKLISKDRKTTRITGNIGDWGSEIVAAKNKELLAFVEKEIDPEIIQVKITGTAHLLDENMKTLSDSITFGLVIAVIIVSLIMALLYRSLRIVLISLIPNIIPLLMIAGIMGFFGIQFKITTAIIFTIAFGICVDDTIHFLSKFNLELKKGKSVLYALKRTYLATGKAIVLTSLILCSGFLMLIFSDFSGTFYTGILITIALFFAVIADLTILPILLLGIKKEAEQPASSNKQTTN
ncbi:MAG: MMPL family transporter [Crocinitomicaceae bacterium]|nr:MMPL family transporter [Crocinitomicaceae bacterium]